MLTKKEELLAASIIKSCALQLPITIAGIRLSNDELNTLLDLIEPNVTRIVHSVDISNVRELLQTVEEHNAKARNTDAG